MVNRVLIILVVVIAAAAGIFLLNRQQEVPEQQPAPTHAQQQPPETDQPGIPSAATGATVEYVHDGDTLFLADGRKVRLLGINTPEIGEERECWGDEATALARQLLPKGTHVWVLPDLEPLDQYGRSLLFIYTDDATNLNLELLRQGAAEVEMYEPNVMFRELIEGAQREAQAAGHGMWGSC